MMMHPVFVNAKRFFTSALCAGLLVASVDVRSAQSEKLAPLAPTVKVSVGSVGQFSDAPIFIALERGYFRQFGIEIELSNFANSGQMIAPISSGQLDVAGGAVAAGLWNAAARGVSVKAVADKGASYEGYSYMGLFTAANSPIKGCADLRGKRIANAAPANGLLYSIELWLRKCGLSLDDVEVSTLAYPDVVPALQTGAIAAGHLGEPLITINTKKGLIRSLATQTDMRPVEEIALLLYSPKFQGRREVAERFMVAYLKGVADYRKAFVPGHAPPSDIVDILVKYTNLKDRNLYAELVPAGILEFGALDQKSLQESFDWFKSKKLIGSQSVAFSDAIDTSFQSFAKNYLEKNPD